MKATAEIQMIPIGSGVSVRKEVKRAHGILQESNIAAQLHANGTNVEGELEDILTAVVKVLETLHAEGTVRISTHLKISTRTDKEPTLGAKLF